MPTRTKAQSIGDQGERFVETMFGEHELWVVRRQTHDFGIDLEAELAQPSSEGQRVLGKLIKLQVKTSQSIERQGDFVGFQIERALLDYADQFRIPVILCVACLSSASVWWLWLQEWVLLNEGRLAQNPGTKTIKIRIPVDQTLALGLNTALPAIANGSHVNAMILALRNIAEAAVGWESHEIAKGVISILDKVHGESRSWTLQKIIDKLLGLGSEPLLWQTQKMLPVLLSLVETSGDSFTAEQVLRLVGRGDSYSRTGISALSHLYDFWREETIALQLPKAFSDADLHEVAWYTAMRERYETGKNDIFAFRLTSLESADLRYGALNLELTNEVLDYIISKWPNRGDSVLLDCLAKTDTH